eukprot:352957-Chlamydomonas_euryale.AAC.3
MQEHVHTYEADALVAGAFASNCRGHTAVRSSAGSSSWRRVGRGNAPFGVPAPPRCRERTPVVVVDAP